MTQETLPAPLVQGDVDTSRLDGFMLDTVKLLGSELLALSTGDEFKAAVVLWCRAWKQRPAASLPDDDRILASFAMVPLAKWKRLRPMALRGFVKCSDGRLYHKVLSADAVRAGKAHKQRQEAIRKRWGKEGDDDTKPITDPPTKPDTGGHSAEHTAVSPPNYETDTKDGTGRDGTGHGLGQGDENAAARGVIEAFDALRAEIWGPTQQRPWPAKTDFVTAQRWLAAGGSVEICRAVFEGQMRNMRGRGKEPPRSLAMFDEDVRVAIRDRRIDAPGTPQRDPATKRAEDDYARALERWARLMSDERERTPKPKRAAFGLPEIGKPERVGA